MKNVFSPWRESGDWLLTLFQMPPLVEVRMCVHQTLHFLRLETLDHGLQLLGLVVVVVLVVGTLEKPGQLLGLFQRPLDGGPPTEGSSGQGDRPVEEAAGERREEVVMHGGPSGLLAHDRDVVRVAAEGSNVGLNPLQS